MSIKQVIFIALVMSGLLLPAIGFPQSPQKVINRQYQSWFSVNTTTRVTGRWGIVADLHERRNRFISDPGFYFARAGINFWLKDNITFTAGYAHLWLAPGVAGFKTYANENRLYQQAQVSSKLGKISMLQRIRNEQRWQQKIVNDMPLDQQKFTERVRYLLSITVPVSKNIHLPAFVVSNELCIQFGKEVVLNTFDQNRVFIGIKQRLNKTLSFDLGYMRVKQQKSSGYQYDDNHTFRLFFYCTSDFRKAGVSPK